LGSAAAAAAAAAALKEEKGKEAKEKGKVVKEESNPAADAKPAAEVLAWEAWLTEGLGKGIQGLGQKLRGGQAGDYRSGI
jgi:hypothetical protein